jgi:hypothetical protein
MFSFLKFYFLHLDNYDYSLPGNPITQAAHEYGSSVQLLAFLDKIIDNINCFVGLLCNFKSKANKFDHS